MQEKGLGEDVGGIGADIRWAEALAAARAAVLEIDRPRGSVTLVPPTVLGQGVPSLTYEAFIGHVHPADRERMDKRLETLSDAPVGTAVHEVFRSLRGTPLEMDGRVVGSDTNGPRVVALLSDETERGRAEEIRQRAMHDLSVAARSAEVFVSMVAHDLKNPIGVIMGTAHHAMEGLSGPALRRALERIRANSARVAQMVEHLRDYARAGQGGVALDRTPTDVWAIVRRVAAEVDAWSRGVTVDKTGDTAGVWDDARLEHAFGAVVHAALELEPGGEVLRVHVDGSDAGAVTTTVACDAVLSAAAVDAAFRPFGSPSEPRGLGLFAGRQAIVAHGGDVTLESSTARGTTFTIRLPRRSDDVARPAPSVWEELASFESGPPLAHGVTASLFGALPLYERAPVAYWNLFERYARLFDAALDRRAYRGESRTATEEIRAIAQALAVLRSGASDVAELHSRALRQRLRHASAAKGQAIVAEGRLLAFELMGHLATCYRKYALAYGGGAAGTGGEP